MERESVFDKSVSRFISYRRDKIVITRTIFYPLLLSLATKFTELPSIALAQSWIFTKSATLATKIWKLVWGHFKHGMTLLTRTVGHLILNREHRKARQDTGLSISKYAINIPCFPFFLISQFRIWPATEYAVIGDVARRIWHKAMKLKYGANERSQMLKVSLIQISI